MWERRGDDDECEQLLRDGEGAVGVPIRPASLPHPKPPRTRSARPPSNGDWVSYGDFSIHDNNDTSDNDDIRSVMYEGYDNDNITNVVKYARDYDKVVRCSKDYDYDNIRVSDNYPIMLAKRDFDRSNEISDASKRREGCNVYP